MSETLSIALKHQEDSFCLDVAFELGPGITALFGPSGAGKTMILDFLAGLRKPDSGHVTGPLGVMLDTQNRVDMRPDQRGIGYVFQHGRLFPHLTVEENLSYGAKWRSSDRQGPAPHDVFQILGLDTLLHRHPADLSGGEQQRVAIGRAFLSRPDWLLMDEPLSSLDTPRRLEILPFIDELSERFQTPILYVSHNADEVLRLADQLILLEDGRMRDQGPVDTVFNKREHFAFLGRADASGQATELGTILTARLTEHDMPFNLSRVVAQGLSLWIPRLPRPIGAEVRLRLSASDIAISRAKPEESSILNTFEAEILEISPAAPGQAHVGLRVSDAIELWAQITDRSVTRLALAPGAKIWGAIKSVAVVTGAAHAPPPKQRHQA